MAKNLLQIIALATGIVIIGVGMFSSILLRLPSDEHPGALNALSSEGFNTILVLTLIVIVALSLLVFCSFSWKPFAGASFQKIIIAIHITTVVFSFVPIVSFNIGKRVYFQTANDNLIQEQQSIISGIQEHLRSGQKYTASEAFSFNFYFTDIVDAKGIFSSPEKTDEVLGLISDALSRNILDPMEVVSGAGVSHNASICNYFYAGHTQPSEDARKKNDSSVLVKILAMLQPYCEINRV